MHTTSDFVLLPGLDLIVLLAPAACLVCWRLRPKHGSDCALWAMRPSISVASAAAIPFVRRCHRWSVRYGV